MNAPPKQTMDMYGPSLAGAKVLVVDDEPGMRHFLTKTLEARVKRVEAVGSPAQATKALDEAQYDLVILDNLMPGGTGLDWLTEQKRRGLFADAIMITAYADLETAIAALRAGVSDFVLKPFRANQILSAVARTLDRKYLQRDNVLLRRELSSGQGHGKLLGNSEPMEDVRAMLARLAPLPTPVLFTGASGTGKEMAARHLHDLSDRADAPFVPVNCATIQPDRFAEELFGVVEGDERLKPGLLLLADGGTLLLDEIAQMPDTVQAA
ncbi:MAG: sigma 54-interacting transcriptional regulator, partial [Pseudomonadota bacterium]